MNKPNGNNNIIHSVFSMNLERAHKAYKCFPNDRKSPESASNRPNEVESSSDFAIMLIPESKPLGEPTGAGSSLEAPGEFRGGD